MNTTADRPSSDSQVRPTMMELQRAQLAALRDGNRARVEMLQVAIFERLALAQADAVKPEE